MNRGEAIEEARQRARQLLHRFGVCAPEHVRVTAFADALGASIVEAGIEGALAQLVRQGSRAHIVVAKRVTDFGARRFCLAHELGHLVLEHPSPAMDAASRSVPAEDRRDLEKEADVFAAELLMPAHLLQRRCEEAPLGLEVVRQIAREYRVSILASAIRFVELTPAACTAVLSDRRGVRWSVPSSTFRHAISRGRHVARCSIAGQFFATGRMNETATAVAADTWIDAPASTLLMEHATTSLEQGTVLSLIWPSATALV